MSDVTVIVYSCIKNSDMWRYFCKSVDLYWKNRNIPIVLLTDSYKESSDWNFDDVICYDDIWSEMIGHAINTVKSKYVMLFMDDYLITEKVSDDDIQMAVNMADEADAFCINLADDDTFVHPIQYKDDDRLFEIPQGNAYCLSLQVALWNSSYLLEFIKGKNWSAWEFERKGSMMINNPVHPILIRKDYAFPYVEGVRKGKWMPNGTRWCREHGEQIDYRVRPRLGLFSMLIMEFQGLLLKLFPNTIVAIQNRK